MALGKKLMYDIVSIVKPETILAWQRLVKVQGAYLTWDSKL
jgi:hypothetical protein